MLNKYKISDNCIPVKDQNSFLFFFILNWFFINYHRKKTAFNFWSWIDFLQKATCEVFL